VEQRVSPFFPLFDCGSSKPVLNKAAWVFKKVEENVRIL
jgi:hypothetical protein